MIQALDSCQSTAPTLLHELCLPCCSSYLAVMLGPQFQLDMEIEGAPSGKIFKPPSAVKHDRLALAAAVHLSKPTVDTCSRQCDRNDTDK
jgi:hypothetical protein